MEWKSNIYFPFSGAIGVFIRGCELGEVGLDCSSGYMQDCAEIKWVEEIDVSNSTDAEWGSWTPWSKCEATCKKYRYRGCISKSSLEGESVCSGSNQESLPCSGGSCIHNDKWGDWSAWSICGHDCKKSRFRQCSNRGSNCKGPRIETTSCQDGHCKVDGGWGDWAPWTPCGNNCMKYRYRGCMNPFPHNGGSECPGQFLEHSSCDGGRCRVDGKWGDWASWSICRSNCKKSRYRKCDNPSPKNGGYDCQGNHKEDSVCTGGRCVVDGGWGNWACWSGCGSNCHKSRYRRCENPTPSNGGLDCEGKHKEVKACSEGRCVINGKWGSWSSWSGCGSNCLKSRYRRCNSPLPKNGGHDCKGNHEENSVCTGERCVVDGGWGRWASWSGCGSCCKMSRYRNCDNPYPENGGSDCEGSNKEGKDCTGG